jgi:DnaJ domain
MHRYDPDRDLYVILGVDPAAPAEDVEAAFRRACLTWHPDKSPAPDAADRFLDVQRAGEVLRDPESRRDYDIVRERHIGRTFRPRRKPPSASPDPFTSPPPEPAEAYVPIRPPPSWMSAKVRVHMDSVLVTLATPPPAALATRVFNGFACAALGGGLALGEVMLGALALVLWAIGRLLYVPPHNGVLAWGKIVPGRRLAELHLLDQRHQNYRRTDIAFEVLRVALVDRGGDYRIEIHGFPRTVAPVLLRTRDIDEAKRCAREAGQWLSLPLAKAA